MSLFQLYFEQGFYHIFNLNARDHILFLVAMLIVFKLRDWKAILWVITSFTLAHSLSLFLSVLNLISIPSNTVELLIIITILFAAIENIFSFKSKNYRVFFSGIFGLIHGLGFSSYLKALLGKEESVFIPLFSFNIGVEVGQLAIVLIMILILWLAYRFFKMKQKSMIFIISLLIAIQSLLWILLRLSILTKSDIPAFLHFIIL